MAMNDHRGRTPNAWPHGALAHLESRLERNYQSLANWLAILNDLRGSRVYAANKGLPLVPSFNAQARGAALQGATTITIDGLGNRTPLGQRSWLVIAGQRYNVTANVDAAPNGVLADCPIEQPRTGPSDPSVGLAAAVADNAPVEVWVGPPFYLTGLADFYQAELVALESVRARVFPEASGQTGAQVITATDPGLLTILDDEYRTEIPGLITELRGRANQYLDGQGNPDQVEVSNNDRTALANWLSNVMGL